ncbi:MAG: prolipoprotein diacylglyceryl transferase [Burkholderiaceae bacterium]
MLQYPQFDPVALKLGPVSIHWYGLMYLLGFAAVWVLGRRRIRQGRTDLSARDLEDIIFYSVIGVVVGGRLGYALLYKPGHYLSHPLEILQVWEGGMSFHGGLIGVIVALFWYAWRRNRHFLDIADFIVPMIPLGLAAGRWGNFMNGELWGRVTDLPWGMVFPYAGPLPRHPSQLYEMLLEGLLLFAFLWWYSSSPRRRGQVSGMFLVGYGIARFFVEFTREPDDFLGLIAAGLSMGQLLSIPMVLAGLLILWKSAGKSSPAQTG